MYQTIKNMKRVMATGMLFLMTVFMGTTSAFSMDMEGGHDMFTISISY